MIIYNKKTLNRDPIYKESYEFINNHNDAMVKIINCTHKLVKKGKNNGLN